MADNIFKRWTSKRVRALAHLRRSTGGLSERYVIRSAGWGTPECHARSLRRRIE
jgi:hypothetical protein